MPEKKAKLEVVDDENTTPPEAAGEQPPETNAEVQFAEIPFRGAVFRIPVEMDEWDTEACLAMSQADYVLAAKLLLGAGQWSMLQTLGSKRKDIREFLLVFSDVINKDCVG